MSTVCFLLRSLSLLLLWPENWAHFFGYPSPDLIKQVCRQDSVEFYGDNDKPQAFEVDLISGHGDPKPDGRFGMKQSSLHVIFTPLTEIRTLISLFQIRKQRLRKMK